MLRATWYVTLQTEPDNVMKQAVHNHCRRSFHLARTLTCNELSELSLQSNQNGCVSLQPRQSPNLYNGLPPRNIPPCRLVQGGRVGSFRPPAATHFHDIILGIDLLLCVLLAAGSRSLGSCCDRLQAIFYPHCGHLHQHRHIQTAVSSSASIPGTFSCWVDQPLPGVAISPKTSHVQRSTAIARKVRRHC